MIPWLAVFPCTVLGKYITEYLIARDWPVTRVRKIVQSCCFLSENIALLIMGRTKNFVTALVCMTVVIGTIKYLSQSILSHYAHNLRFFFLIFHTRFIVSLVAQRWSRIS